jgi:alkanesulfonate monooxygenase SsuD/methylene tetrahydromethanopterin reductase-like flavin-dependent oxidoreductase (luciferase family)
MHGDGVRLAGWRLAFTGTPSYVVRLLHGWLAAGWLDGFCMILKHFLSHACVTAQELLNRSSYCDAL